MELRSAWFPHLKFSLSLHRGAGWSEVQKLTNSTKKRNQSLNYFGKFTSRGQFKNKTNQAPLVFYVYKPEKLDYYFLVTGEQGSKGEKVQRRGREFNVPFLGYNIVSKNHSVVIKKGCFFVGFFFVLLHHFEKLISQVKGDRKYFIHWKAASNIFRIMPPYRKRERKKNKVVEEVKGEDIRGRGADL